MEIVITDCDHGFITPEREMIEGAGHRLLIQQCRTGEDVVEAAREADALICQAAPITAAVLGKLPRCKVVGRYGVGLDNVDINAATALGIKVVHVPDFCSDEVAEHAVSLILALARKITTLNDLWKQDPASFVARWNQRLGLVRGVRRFGQQVIGVLGLGKIGRGVATRCRALGFNVVGYDPYVKVEQTAEWNISTGSLNQVLTASDILTLHVPLTESTRGLVGAEELRRMKDTACLVNTSRGDVIVEAALVRALKEKKIAGAALDVTSMEPLPTDHPFLEMENVILTPHVAFYSDDSIRDVKRRTAAYVLQALHGEGEYALANPEVLSK